MQITLYISSPGPFDMQAQDATLHCWIFRDTHWREGRFFLHDFMSLIFLEMLMSQTQKKGSHNTTQMNPPIGQSNKKFGAAIRDPD